MKNLKKGFTLIELLVVVAIIGILASVVLASLTTARSKGKDAAIQAQLSNMRAQAELYYASNNNYGGSGTAYVAATGLSTAVDILPTSCTTAKAGHGSAAVGGSLFGQPSSASGLFGLLMGACNSGAAAITGAVHAGIATKWAVTATGTTNGSTTTYYCVDSAGTSASKTSAYTITGGVCS